MCCASLYLKEGGMRTSGIVLVVVLCFVSSTAWAEFYRWKDAAGHEYYANDLLQVPQEYRASAEKMEPDVSRVSVGARLPKAAVSAPGSAGKYRDRNGRGEDYWRIRAAKLRKEISRFQNELDVITKQEADEKERPARLMGRRTGSAATRDRKKAQLGHKIARLRRELEVELPDEARRADALPGWIRE